MLRPTAHAMPVVSEMVHPRSMDFRNQRKCIMLRDTQGLAWTKIAPRLQTLRGAGHHPSPSQCRKLYTAFSAKLGRRPYKYSKCGRKPWKVTPDMTQFIVQRLLYLRNKCICTSTTLQREVLREKHVQVEASTIRKVLKKQGFRWLPRRQKPRYTKDDRAARRRFAQDILDLGPRRFREHFAMSMDGVVLAVPPSDHTDRENFCHVGDTHMWRKRTEAAQPELAGDDMYTKQIPRARAVPFWGGIGPGGFGLVLFHPGKKVKTHQWVEAAEGGRLVAACKRARPDRDRGPWHILCDNERFLEAPASRAVHARQHVRLCHVPRHSPDLNPVELFWGWLRKQLRRMDMADFIRGRPPVTRAGLKARVRGLVQTLRAKRVAAQCFLSLAKTCQAVKRKRGAASGA